MSTSLLLVDAQRTSLVGPSAVPRAHEVVGLLRELLDAARGSGAAVVHVQNDGPPGDVDATGTEGWGLVFPVAGGEQVVHRTTADVFTSDPRLAGQLRADGVDRLVVAGLHSESSVDASVRGALGLGFEVVLAADAQATGDGDEPAAAVEARVCAGLRDAGARVVPTAEAVTAFHAVH